MKWLRQRLPRREALEANRWLRPFARTLASPLVWRFNRRGVARGVALGLFAAFAIPIAQTPFAAAFALGLRANLPVAAISTLVTNPFTFPVVYLLAYQVGGRFLDFRAEADRLLSAGDNPVDRAFTTAVQAVGTTYLGLMIFAILGAALGYLLTQGAWRLWVSRRWARRQQARREAPAEAG